MRILLVVTVCSSALVFAACSDGKSDDRGLGDLGIVVLDPPAGSDDGGTPTPTPTSDGGVVSEGPDLSTPPGIIITVGDNFFSPTSATVPVGATVTWYWGTPFAQTTAEKHTVTSGTSPTADGVFCNDQGQPTPDTCDTITNAKTSGIYSYTFTAAGTYPYFDEVHPDTKGTITVGP